MVLACGPKDGGRDLTAPPVINFSGCALSTKERAGQFVKFEPRRYTPRIAKQGSSSSSLVRSNSLRNRASSKGNGPFDVVPSELKNRVIQRSGLNNKNFRGCL